MKFKKWLIDRDFIVVELQFSKEHFHLALLGHEVSYYEDNKALFGISFGVNYFEISLFWIIFRLKKE